MEPLEAAPNLPLGIEDRFPYHQETCVVAPGETLLLYSDGVYERQNPQGERLGLLRLQEVLSAAPRSVANHRKQESLNSQVIDFPIHGFRILPRKGNLRQSP
jgi:serine phosphatase RsbU (regulator of sigma subunit)